MRDQSPLSVLWRDLPPGPGAVQERVGDTVPLLNNFPIAPLAGIHTEFRWECHVREGRLRFRSWRQADFRCWIAGPAIAGRPTPAQSLPGRWPAAIVVSANHASCFLQQGIVM